jgi:hypothetical protein
LKLNELHKEIAAMRLNPFEFRAGLKKCSMSNTTNLTVLIPMNSELAIRARITAKALAALMS